MLWRKRKRRHPQSKSPFETVCPFCSVLSLVFSGLQKEVPQRYSHIYEVDVFAYPLLSSPPQQGMTPSGRFNKASSSTRGIDNFLRI